VWVWRRRGGDDGEGAYDGWVRCGGLWRAGCGEAGGSFGLENGGGREIYAWEEALRVVEEELGVTELVDELYLCRACFSGAMSSSRAELSRGCRISIYFVHQNILRNLLMRK
jgi:hypothetical protein